MTEENKLATQSQGPSALALNNQEVDDLFGQDSIEVSNLSFDKIAIMRETPNFDLGSGQLAPTLTGFVLFTHPSYTWWKEGFADRDPSERGAPNCAASMGVFPDGGDNIQSPIDESTGKPGVCASCPQYQYGSGKGGVGSACRLGAKILFLGEGEVLPSVISLPPTSVLGKDSSYTQWLTKVINAVASAFKACGVNLKNKQCWPAKVELTLASESFQTGNSASVLNIRTLGVLVPDTVENKEKLMALGKQKAWAVETYLAEIHKYLGNEDAGEAKQVESTATEVEVETEADEDIPI